MVKRIFRARGVGVGEVLGQGREAAAGKARSEAAWTTRRVGTWTGWPEGRTMIRMRSWAGI
ncbi:hypothetical protein Aple_031590 [Acrocarpospora pleiomorpha]|uniref:Uncharacterized protein n=1 Tax=Acrocarpospora pleiomorpha TaxID=90975 RepID=A0A5M3XM78_9ACTN|nr:hypothetical protein Aple_031590 [Acrocarpospora pleiomorpha]